jgi:subtilisin-like proprotein convertase family protein/subtilisin family serine protease
VLISGSTADAQVVTQLDLAANDLIYDPGTQRIYASVPPDSITVIDPFTGTVGPSIVVGNTPNRLAISDDGQFLYVGLDGDFAVRRVTLATLTPGLVIPLGTGAFPYDHPRAAEDIAVLPGSPNSIAVARRVFAVSPQHAGVAIFDNAVQRPVETAVHSGSNVIEFSGSAARLYGYNTETSESGFRRMAVDGTGATVIDTTRDVVRLSGDIKFAAGLIYSTAGQVVDPEPRTLVGTFAVGCCPSSVVPDVGVGRVFFLQNQTILAFNAATFIRLGTFQVAAASGTTGRLIRWGDEGLAFRTSEGQVFLVEGSIDSPDLVETAVSNPPSTTAAGASFMVTDTVTNSGAGDSGASTTRYYLSLDRLKDPSDVGLAGLRNVPALTPAASSSGSVLLTVVSPTPGGTYFLLHCADDFQEVTEFNEANNCSASTTQVVVEPAGSSGPQVVTQLALQANDLVYDPGTQKIYASVPSTAGPVGNTITVIDPFTRTIGSSVFVGSEPNRLALSGDGQFLYVGLDGAAAVRRVAVATLVPGLQVPLGNDALNGPRFAGDIAVLPGSPQSFAVSRRYISTSPEHAGVAIFDGAVSRPTETATHTGSNVIEFSASPSRLYGYNNGTTEFGFRRMSVDASGVAVLDVTQDLISGFGADIKVANGLVYSTTGSVIDPEDRTLLGTFDLGFAFTSSVVPDVSLDRVFFLQGQNILAFHRATLAPVGTFQVAAASGDARSLVRWGPDGLAFRTATGQVFLVEGPIESADLLETAITNPPAAATPGATFTLTDTVQNQGPGASMASTTRYYLSLNPVRDGGDFLMGGMRAVPELLTGSSNSGSTVVTVPVAPGGAYFVLACADDLQAILEANELNNCAATAGQLLLEPFDPLVQFQWHLQPRSLEPAAANVIPLWPTTKGGGVAIGIVDDGLEHTHPDLQPNYSAALSFDFIGNDPDPTPGLNPHGTAVAGIAGARGDNGIGGSGAAPLATLAGLRLLVGPISDAQIAQALSHLPQDIHLLSNSWGPNDNGSLVLGPGPFTQAAIEAAATGGRAGKGRIFVWAAGNGAQNLDNCNFDGYATNRFAIAVAAYTDFQQPASYSEPCSALMVTAPSSGGARSITTTDLVGNNGYAFGDYTDIFGGTSAAAPLVSGAVALMLEANPQLTWRDVQHILVRSSHRVQPGDPGWTMSRFPHHERFGFGLIDAAGAVHLARSWRSVLPERSILPLTRSLNVPILDDDATGRTDAITLDASFASFRVEHMEVEFTATHTWRGDLEVTLVSPSGVASRLATVRPLDSNDNLIGWRFRTVRHWGESAAGTWTLRVADAVALDVGTWHSWTLRVYGTQPANGRRPAADFDGDARNDLALYRSGTWLIENRQATAFGNASDVPVPGDYDGDGIADIAVFRPSDGNWHIAGQPPVQWGFPGYLAVPADYNADGRTDIAVFRDGVWYVRGMFVESWGVPGDIPVPADYNGDGILDLAVFRPADGVWHIRGVGSFAFGDGADIPVPADYNGDGVTDIAVFRPASGTWFVRGQFSIQWGANADLPVGLDVTGDGRADLVIYRRNSATWFALDPVTGNGFFTNHGAPGDLPAMLAPWLATTRMADMDGDRRADIAVFRPSTAAWITRRSSIGFTPPVTQTFGQAGDVPVPGDYFGIGWEQLATYRSSGGTWRIEFGPTIAWGGAPDDRPVPGDYDGDRRTDIAVWRESEGVWYVLLSSLGWQAGVTVRWGVPGDIPVPADYNGDLVTDLAVFRPSTATWYVRGGFVGVFGLPGDVPMPGDYNGDGRADAAVFRPADGTWDVNLAGFESFAFGAGTDIPVAADFNGDGRTDVAVFRPSTATWYVRGLLTIQHGMTGDTPLPRRP